MGRLREFDDRKAVDAAADCFWSRGYEATSVRDLTESMGISGASLYNAYGDKRALFATALARYAERSMRERIQRLESGNKPKQAIRAFIEEIVERSVKDRDRKGCLLINSALDVAPHDAWIGRVVAGYLDEIRGFFRRNLLAAQAAGQVPAGLDAEDVSGHLLGIVAGIRVLARTSADPALLAGVARPALALLDHPKAKRPSRKKE